MEKKLFFSILAILLLLGIPNISATDPSSECLKKNHCLPRANTTYTYVTFAGVTTDPKAFGEQFTTKATTSCHYGCNISCLWAGSFECPNNCYANLKRGSCSNNSCVCAAGWRGSDCGLPACPENPCSNLGLCNPTTQMCECISGADLICGSPLNNEPVLPWGELFPNETYWHHNDKYQDDHPVFNTSRVAIIRLNMTQAQLQQLLSPANDWTNNCTSANMTFSNGYVEDVTITNVGVRNHGSYSRTYLNKGFTIDLHVLNSSNPKLFGLKRLAIRPTAYDLTLTRGTLINDWYRLMGVPAARNSWCVLYLNDVHIGLLLLYEEFDDVYFDAHFGGGGQGNFYKAGAPGASLELRSTEASYYQKLHTAWPEGSPGTYVYQLSQGSGNWSDFLTFIMAVNSNLTGDAYIANLNATFDIDNYLRQLAVEQMGMRWDSYTYNSNNWGIYFNNKTNQFVFIPYDLEGSIGSEGKAPEMRTGNFAQWGTYSAGRVPSTPLTSRILAEPQLRETYVMYTRMLLERIWAADNGTQITTRLNAFHKTLAVQVAEDMEWEFDCERTYSRFNSDLTGTVLPWIETRALSTLTQLKAFNTTSDPNSFGVLSRRT